MHKNRQLNILQLMPNNAINPDVQKRRFALLLHAGYGERWGLHFNGKLLFLAIIEFGMRNLNFNGSGMPSFSAT